jgi:hypothetical protein
MRPRIASLLPPKPYPAPARRSKGLGEAILDSQLACVGAACLFFTPVTRGSLCSRCDAVVPAIPAIFTLLTTLRPAMSPVPAAASHSHCRGV